MNKLLVAFLVLFSSTSAAFASFSDIAEEQEFFDAIEYVQANDIVDGYSNGTYRQDQKITRAEFTKIVVNSVFSKEEIDNCNSANIFSDIAKDNWSFPYICIAKNKSIIVGYQDGTFKPENKISFAEAAKIISIGFLYDYEEDEVWYKPFISILGDENAIPISIHSVDQEITRGEMAEIIYRLKTDNQEKSSADPEEILESSESEPIIQSNGASVKAEIKETPLNAVKIADIPILENSHCFDGENRSNPECSKFFEEKCSIYGYCFAELACPKYLSPVTGKDGLFYPSKCWAEQLGTSVESYGYSDSLKQFISDLWATPKTFGSSYLVDSPNLEFSYHGSGWQGDINFASLRSSIWNNKQDFEYLTFYASADGSVAHTKQRTSNPVMNYLSKTLLVYVMFDDAYPKDILLEWTDKYEEFMNDYFKKKQNVTNPIQYDLMPVVISPPQGVERPSTTHLFFSADEIEKMYAAAIEETKERDFSTLVVSPVFIHGFGGYYSGWNNMEFIVAPLIPPAGYSLDDKIQGVEALIAFQQMFSTISHEVLHAVGLPGDHLLMGYGTTYLETVGQDVDHKTGEYTKEVSTCVFLGNSLDYYSVEVPSNLAIKVGEEPDSLYKEESDSGNCLSGLYNNDYLKDADNDGVYEIMYKNNLIGVELQRFLGWVDIDSDGVSELEDVNPYGGLTEVSSPNNNFDDMSSTFTPLGEVTVDNCKFQRIKLENGIKGLFPLSCREFNDEIVNIYNGVKYKWRSVEKEYGTVLLPLL